MPEYEWFKSVMTGLVSAVVVGLVMGFGNGTFGIISWLVCYVLFLSMNESKATKYAAIAIMIIVGSVIGNAIQSFR
ncbi:MAG: hypothetical protein DKINENOH_00856 [bacterium]|nr:hypothetical protein [bacterium]